ncbi:MULTISPECIES: HNH endonuclease [unclassified Paenibacillus]|uniref:HNH endonuclease n=1 Tax=unclassified Paenibacillus TaxID=185978 RepID=UPI0024072DA5|nr:MULTISPECIES: HNH endonuclease [unclassified Paenibacillus]
MYGIVARGVINGSPIIRIDEEAKQYWKSTDWNVPGLGVPIELLEVKVSDGFIPRTDIKLNKALENLLILRMANQTNYKVSEVHATELNKLWCVSDVAHFEEEEAKMFSEGKRVYRLHRTIERNPNLIRAAKELYKQKDKYLSCMACGFSFIKQYGPIGENYIEGHHTVPISSMEDVYQAKIEDIALVCANCHRMLHCKREWLRMDQLKELLQS